MAKATGGDVVVRLISDVSELQDNMLAATENVEALLANLKKANATLVRLSRTVGEMADILATHEKRLDAQDRRLAALEARQ